MEFKALREVPPQAGFKRGDVMVVFGELFQRGYANGIVDEAEKAGMTVIRSTVGRRETDGSLRPLKTEELQSWPKPYINIPLEAGFDMEPANDGTTPVDQLKNVKMNEWDQVKLDWTKINESRANGTKRFKKYVAQYMTELQPLIPKGANVVFVHTMAGGVPRAKILMPTMNKVFKGTGDRFIESEKFWQSELGRLSEASFEEVTANTFQHLLELSQPVREEVEKNGGKVSYVAYGYHGTEVMIRGEYRWQTYPPYLQGWAKMRLEKFAEDAWKKGVKTQVFNCPEILTNSTTIFLGVEVSLYPLLAALRKEGGNSSHVKEIERESQSLLKDEHSIDELLKVSDEYLSSPVVKPFIDFKNWPKHSGKEQMELLLGTSERLINMHKDEKALITYLLSEQIFLATGEVMFRQAWAPTAPVLWLGHDILAKVITQASGRTS
jgi:hypothetical protein